MRIPRGLRPLVMTTKKTAAGSAAQVIVGEARLAYSRASGIQYEREDAGEGARATIELQIQACFSSRTASSIRAGSGFCGGRFSLMSSGRRKSFAEARPAASQP